MCSECRQTPCASRCPNADDPPIVTYCVKCHLPIREGEDYFDVEGDPFCENCMHSFRKTAGED